ncbi:phosphotransferase enzyme family protein [Microlunatus speluncae]|uniref:phosphotransferase enzyme family protein n=1 Tax=Microlunatus speluncae TaxID=2594267 RepID=UPI0012663868|nr:phosphotransferase [Microlunatus speluncae]
MDALPEGLLRAVADRYGVRGRARSIAAGVSGSSLWRLDSDPPVLLRIARHYGLDHVHRACTAADRLARVLPEVVSPLRDSEQAMAFEWAGRPVTLWPFVDGAELDRRDPDLIKEAARLLARLHRAPVAADVSDPDIPGEDNAEAAAALLPDSGLDDWFRHWRDAPVADASVGWSHGDFFWRNLLCRDGSIVGLIDWDDVRFGRVIIELAWSTWEFGKSDRGDALRLDRATEFLSAYRQSGGQVDSSADLIPIIRERLRRDIAFFRRIARLGHRIDPADERAKFDAFESLARISL